MVLPLGDTMDVEAFIAASLPGSTPTNTLTFPAGGGVIISIGARLHVCTTQSAKTCIQRHLT